MTISNGEFIIKPTLGWVWGENIGNCHQGSKLLRAGSPLYASFVCMKWILKCSTLMGGFWILRLVCYVMAVNFQELYLKCIRFSSQLIIVEVVQCYEGL